MLFRSEQPLYDILDLSDEGRIIWPIAEGADGGIPYLNWATPELQQAISTRPTVYVCPSSGSAATTSSSAGWASFSSMIAVSIVRAWVNISASSMF